MADPSFVFMMNHNLLTAAEEFLAQQGYAVKGDYFSDEFILRDEVSLLDYPLDGILTFRRLITHFLKYK